MSDGERRPDLRHRRDEPSFNRAEDGIDCPAVYDTDTEVVIVQGYVLQRRPITVPGGEDLVAVPKSLIGALAAQLGTI